MRIWAAQGALLPGSAEGLGLMRQMPGRGDGE